MSSTVDTSSALNDAQIHVQNGRPPASLESISSASSETNAEHEVTSPQTTTQQGTAASFTQASYPQAPLTENYPAQAVTTQAPPEQTEQEVTSPRTTTQQGTAASFAQVPRPQASLREDSPAQSVAPQVAPTQTPDLQPTPVQVPQSTRTSVASGSSNQRSEPAETNSTRSRSSQQRWSWWMSWRWEVTSAIVSVSSMFLIIAILVDVQNKPLSAWKLSIQPNSMISVLTTVGETAMMVQVASGLCQLKWKYFQQPNNLMHLQLLDDASRGPWGAMMMIIGIRLRSLLATSLAIVAILGLATTPLVFLSISQSQPFLRNFFLLLRIVTPTHSTTMAALRPS